MKELTGEKNQVLRVCEPEGTHLITTRDTHKESEIEEPQARQSCGSLTPHGKQTHPTSASSPGQDTELHLGYSTLFSGRE